MKASCDDKENEGRETQQEYRPSLIEMAPLFTSLHVDEAGKTGLMGNRVPFYEQFTVSPQRFAQFSAPCRSSAAHYSCSEECVLKECHHLSPSHIPVLPPSMKAQGFACPFFGTMDDTAVCDSKPSGSNTLLDTVATMTTKGDNLKHIATKIADTPPPSNHTILDKEESNDGKGLCHTPVADVMKLVKRAHYLSIGDRSQCVSDLKQLAPQSESHTNVGCESSEVDGKVITKDEVLLMVSKQDQDTSCKEHSRRTARVLSSECSQQVESIGMKNVLQSKGSDTEGVPFDRPMSNSVEVPGPCSAEEHMVIIEDDLKHGKEYSADARCACDSLIESTSICKIEVETALPSRGAGVSMKPCEGSSSILDTSNRANTGVRNKCGACGESANKNNCHCGVAESTQEEIEIRNSLNDSESCCSLSLSPKAVIQALGQLRFWKARVALIRQQQIFSDQVFELHKLIEVQRLLAGSPDISIDEIYFGVGHMNLECDADALASHSGLVGKKENVRDALGKQIVVSKQVANSINSRAPLEQCLAVPGVVEGGVSAWGYPGLGVRHWTRSLSAAGAFPYQSQRIKVVPRSAVTTPASASEILMSIQHERKPQL